MKHKIIISLITAFLAAFSPINAQERQLVINLHNSVKQYPVTDVQEVEFKEQLLPPAAVRCAVNGNSVVVSWTQSKGATNYTVQRKSNTGVFATIGSSSSTTYTDASPLVGENRYRVIANGDIDSSQPSEASKPAKFVSTNLEDAKLYLGIIGFNDATKELPMNVLTKSNQTSFTSFVNSLATRKGTLLYYSVDQALEMLSTNQLPSDLTTVAIVTFTDGLDQGSMMKTSEYSSQTNYLNSINERLSKSKINGTQIEAYAIGLRGNDVKDAQDFRNKLKYLASKQENAIEITNISQLNEKLNEIASKLSFIHIRTSIELKVSANPGTRVRFTFDALPQGDNPAALSNLYIEGTYKKSTDNNNVIHYFLEDIVYHGISSSSGTKVEGQMSSTLDGINFKFADVEQDNGSPLSLNNYRRWRYISSLSYWQAESEGSEKLESTSETIYRSGAVVLNLDCSTSLGSQFSTVKNQANEFIKKLANKTPENIIPDHVGFTSIAEVAGDYDWNYYGLLQNDQGAKTGLVTLTVTNAATGEVTIDGIFSSGTGITGKIKGTVDLSAGTLTVANKQDLGADSYGDKNYFYIKELDAEGKLVAGVSDAASVVATISGKTFTFPKDYVFAIGDFNDESLGWWKLTCENEFTEYVEPSDGLDLTEWTSFTTAEMIDGWILPVMSYNDGSYVDPADFPLSVNVLQNKEDEKLFALQNPYMSASGFPVSGGTEGYIVIDLTDPEFVLVKPEIFSGFNNGSNGIFCINVESFYVAQGYSKEEIQSALGSQYPEWSTAKVVGDKTIVSIPTCRFHYAGATDKMFTWTGRADAMKATITIKRIGSTGVNTVAIDKAAEKPIFYNLQGVPVEEPTNGLFFEVSRHKTAKVMK